MADRLLAPLPDLFLRADGTRVKNASEWAEHRKYLLDLVVGTEYGGMPPRPDHITVEQLSTGNVNDYRVRIGSFSFCLKLYLPNDLSTPRPVILNGDGCWRYITTEIINEINRRGVILATFNRVEFAPDMYNTSRDVGIYSMYPDIPFSALSAWAWGYHRAMDALCTLSFVDQSRVALSGHSRGGKTVLLAGATDERFAYVNTNNSGAAGAGCYRYHMELEAGAEGQDPRSEHLADLLRAVPYWLGPEMKQYENCEENIPFDQHMLKVLVAPRYLLQTEALGDTWANPKGTWQTHLAAREAWKLLGCEKNICVRYREGGHNHDFGAFCALLDLMEKGPAPEVNPFPEMEKIFSWAAPEQE